METKPAKSSHVLTKIYLMTGARGMAVIVELAIMAVISRLVTPKEFGVLAAAMFFLAICNLFREGGISSTIIQFKELDERLIRAAVTLAMISAIVIFLIIQVIAPFYSAFMRMPELKDVIRVLAIIFPIQAVAIVSRGLLDRRLKSPLVTMCELTSKILGFLLIGFWLAYEGWGYWALVLSWIGETCILSILLFTLARPSIVPLFDMATFRLLTSKTSGFATSKIITFVATRADDVIVGRFLDAASLGLYTRAYKLMSQPADLYTTVADRVVFPSFAKLQDDRKKLRAAFLSGTDLTAMVGIPLSVLFYVTAPELIRLLLGPNWTGVIPIFSVLAAATYFRIGGRVSASVLKATASFRKMIMTQMIYAGLTISLSLFAVSYGLIAVGIAIGAAIIMWFVLISAMGCSVTGVSLGQFIKAHTHGVLLGILSGGGAYLVAHLARAEQFSDAITLLLTALYVMALGLLLFIARPTFLIGATGHQIIGHLTSALAPRMRKFMRREGVV